MNRSRFDKLEGEREESEPTSSGASLERFSAEPELSERAEPVDPMQPLLGAERLQRFDTDGAQGLRLDRDPLAALPMLQCPACGAECGKFEAQCHQCRASLESPEARAHNLKRLEAFQTQTAATQRAGRDRLEAQQLDAPVRALEKSAAAQAMARELFESYSDHEGRLLGAAWQWWVAAGVFFGLAGVAPWLGLKLLAIALGMICVLTRVPRRAWARLGQSARSRDR